MKVACLLGSPRSRGNTAALCAEVLRPLEEGGAEVRRFELNRMSFRGCQDCNACKTKAESCVLKDELSDPLAYLAEAEVWVLASPVYFGDVTGPFKTAFDRLYGFLKPGFTELADPARFPKGKRCVFVTAQGAPDENMFVDVFPRYRGFLEWLGFTVIRPVRAIGAGPAGAVADMEELLAEAREAGKAMLAE